MKTVGGCRCDGCGIIEVKDPLARDRRPPPGSRDRFYDFVVPPVERHPLVPGRPHPGKFRGIASQSEPNKLAALHSCPTCATKIRKSFAKMDPELLPEGPLKVLMRQIKLKYSMSSLRMLKIN